MRRAFKFRLYPSKAQRDCILEQFYQCRILNQARLEPSWTTPIGVG